MLNIFKDMGPNIEQIVDMGFSSPKGIDCSLEDEKNLYLNSQAMSVYCGFRLAVECHGPTVERGWNETEVRRRYLDCMV